MVKCVTQIKTRLCLTVTAAVENYDFRTLVMPGPPCVGCPGEIIITFILITVISNKLINVCPMQCICIEYKIT